MKFASTCTGSELSKGGEGKEGEKKVQKEREEGNQGRSDTPCSFPTLGRRGANQSDQIHFPESIFCFVNSWAHPFPASPFLPSFSCLLPAFNPYDGHMHVKAHNKRCSVLASTQTPPYC